MELTELRQRYRADREFTVERDGVSLRLRMLGPLELPARMDFEAHGAELAVLRRAVIGWSNIPAADLIPEAEGELPFDREFIPGVCARYVSLALDAYLRLAERLAALEDAKKNSASTSTR